MIFRRVKFENMMISFDDKVFLLYHSARAVHNAKIRRRPVRYEKRLEPA
ncbi:hypothetical protein ELI_4038 [Eubacterium callanderi]|uniref:Uncharacterized protein n=1 Tax=Eubacterium callanderi TaxID=53442 RepID=E3GH27_9FIRM|nr:hypothetical protein ELI_4038 [Eubacterium callanderi]